MVRVLVFDTETSGVDPTEAFLVTACLAVLNASGEVEKEWNWIIDQGMDVPEEAAGVHGYTTERVRAEGRKDVYACLIEIANVINMHCKPGSQIPLVSHNSPYDLTLINHEWKRHNIGPLDFERYPILDTLTCDKGLDKWRKGSRKLTDIAEQVYGVEAPGGDAHEARYDAILAGRVALKMRDKLRALYVDSGSVSAFWEWLMFTQVEWKREQAESLQKYLRSAKNKNGADPEAVVSPDWPMKPYSDSI